MLIEKEKIPKLIRNICETIDDINEQFGEITKEQGWNGEYGYWLKENEKYSLW